MASGIEVSWATPNRLIRLPGQPGTPAIDPGTCERIDTDGAYGEDCPHRRRMAGAALIYEDLRPVDGAMLEALLSCEGLPGDCRAGTEEPEDDFDILALWDEFMDEEDDRALAPSECRASHPDGEGDAARRPVPERNAERSGLFSLRETPEQQTPRRPDDRVPAIPLKRPLSVPAIRDDDPCTFTVSTRYASIATHAIAGTADRVDEGVEHVLDDFIASRLPSSRTCSNRDEAARLLRRNILYMCRTYDPTMARQGIGPDVAEARRVQRRADERRIARSLRLQDSHVLKAAQRMGAPVGFLRKLAGFLPRFREWAGRVAATALRRIFTRAESVWFRRLFAVVREFVQGYRCRQWGLDPSLVEQVEGMSGGTVVVDGRRGAGGRNLYVRTVNYPNAPEPPVARPRVVSAPLDPFLLPLQRWKRPAEAAFTAGTVRA